MADYNLTLVEAAAHRAIEDDVKPTLQQILLQLEEIKELLKHKDVLLG